MDNVIALVIPLSVCVVLPVMIVWIVARYKTNETNRRAEIVLAAIERNADMDIGELLRKLSPPEKSLRQKLLGHLSRACMMIMTGLGIMVLLALAACTDVIRREFLNLLFLLAGMPIVVGVASLAVYFISRRVQARELSEEENGK